MEACTLANSSKVLYRTYVTVTGGAGHRLVQFQVDSMDQSGLTPANRNKSFVQKRPPVAKTPLGEAACHVSAAALLLRELSRTGLPIAILRLGKRGDKLKSIHYSSPSLCP